MEMVLVDAARAGTDPGACKLKREGSLASAMMWAERSAKVTGAAGRV